MLLCRFCSPLLFILYMKTRSVFQNYIYIFIRYCALFSFLCSQVLENFFKSYWLKCIVMRAISQLQEPTNLRKIHRSKNAISPNILNRQQLYCRNYVNNNSLFIDTNNNVLTRVQTPRNQHRKSM